MGSASKLSKENCDVLPDAETLKKASELKIYAEDGSQVTFGSIFQDEKTIVVFVRHFFCSVCQAYVAELSGISDEDLKQAGVKVVVIGCGHHEPIPSYRKNTNNFRHPIYADPTRALYKTLNMTLESFEGTPAGVPRRKYAEGTLLYKIVSGLSALKTPFLIGKQGNFGQLGGEFILGPGQQCTFAHRMLHTEDHTDPSDLLKKSDPDPAAPAAESASIAA